MKKKNKKTDEKQNPLHKEYGLFSNARYILKNMFGYAPIFWVLVPIGVICAPLMNYLWTFIGKLVIDMITGEKGWEALLWVMAIVALIQIVSTMLNTWYYSKWPYYVTVRFKMMIEKNRKAMTIDFKNIEDSDVLDCYQKAGRAADSNMEGIEGMMRTLVNFLISLSVVIAGLIILGTMNILIVLIMAALAVITFIVRNKTNAKVKKKVWDPLAPWWRKNSYMSDITSDFQAAKDIRMFGLSDWLTEKFRNEKKVRLNAQKMNAKMWIHTSNFTNLCFSLSQALVYAYLLYLAVNGEITLGNFSLYLASSTTFYNYVRQIMDNTADLMARSREVDDWRSFLDFEGGNPDQGKPVPETSSYEFRFKNVSFKYPKAENYALKNLNLTLKAGERLAVVGLNGAGKTTFIKLLCRLYDVTEGEILIDGINIKEYSEEEYRKLFAVVFQDFQLFAFSLRENIALTEEADDEKINEVLKQSGLYEDAQKLEQGLDTCLFKGFDEKGTDLSGGQKQKAAISRALYRNAPIVILDEPTAALDPIAEYEIYRRFNTLVGGKTAIYISHRLSSCKFCHRIAVFANDTIEEYGTHEELYKKPHGIYAEMFSAQAQYYTDFEVGSV